MIAGTAADLTAKDGDLSVTGTVSSGTAATLEATRRALTVAGTVTAGTTADLKAHQALTLESTSQVEAGESLTATGKTLTASGTLVTGREREQSTLTLTGLHGVTLGERPPGIRSRQPRPKGIWMSAVR